MQSSTPALPPAAPALRRLPQGARKRVRTGIHLNRIPPATRHAALCVLGALVFSKLVPAGANYVFVGCAVFALLGARQAIQALAVMLVVLMASPAWASASIKDLRWLVLGTAFLSVMRVAMQARRPLPDGARRVIVTAVAYAAFQLLVALGVSRLPSISIFKLISFSTGVFTIVAGFACARRGRPYWNGWFAGWFGALLLAGPLCTLWGGGYTKNASGFEGAFEHPQTQGVILGIGASFFLGRYLLYQRGHYGYLIAGIIALAQVYLSQSRTGGFAFLLAGGATVAITALRSEARIQKTRLVRGMPLAVLACVGILVTVPGKFSELMDEYVDKGDKTAGNVIHAFEESRESLMDRSLYNYRQHPIIGIGFGMPSTEFTDLKTLYGIPLSASVEKGFLPTAILEETGLIGCVLAIGLLGTICLAQIQTGNMALLWAMLAALLMNLGEAMFFSMGGLGLFVWLTIGWAMVPATTARRLPARLRQEKREPTPAGPVAAIAMPSERAC